MLHMTPSVGGEGLRDGVYRYPASAGVFPSRAAMSSLSSSPAMSRTHWMQVGVSE